MIFCSLENSLPCFIDIDKNWKTTQLGWIAAHLDWLVAACLLLLREYLGTSSRPFPPQLTCSCQRGTWTPLRAPG